MQSRTFYKDGLEDVSSFFSPTIFIFSPCPLLGILPTSLSYPWNFLPTYLSLPLLTRLSPFCTCILLLAGFAG